MAVFNEPTKWQTSLVNSGDANTIPQNTPVGTGEASFEDGFPQITQVPIGAGGQAPDRKDFNGLFKVLGDSIFYMQNGGLWTYNSAYDYAVGRVVLYNDSIYKCIRANGVSSTVVTPDSGTEYWQRIDNFVRSVNGVNADASGNVTDISAINSTSGNNSFNYIKFSNGLALMWGKFLARNTLQKYNFPFPLVAVPTVTASYQQQQIQPSGSDIYVSADTVSFTLISVSPETSVQVQIMGFWK